MSLQMLARMGEALTAPYQRGMETLGLAFGATAADGTTAIQPYDFTAYTKLYHTLPDAPRYLLVPTTAVTDPLAVKVSFKRSPLAATEDTVVDVPAGSIPNRGLAIPLPGTANTITAALRLLQIQPLPQPPAGLASANWKIVVLLGNLSKLLWVVGSEQEALRGELDSVDAQRNAGLAYGKSLDWIGQDLGVPRFPPTAYTWDPQTIALYHLDDPPPGTAVDDDRARYDPLLSHPGVSVGGIRGAPGRFGTAFRFVDVGTYVGIKHHTDFLIGAADAFTVEAQIRPDPTITATGAVIAKRTFLNQDTQPGWSLSVGSFRGIDHNLRFAFSDGTANAEHELFADRDLARDGAYHHVAGSLERRPAGGSIAHLYVDGKEVRTERLSVGALSNGVDIQIGYGQELAAGPAQYHGLIDEVRISSAARNVFNPAVGEADDQYRRRLKVFQQWVLPSRDVIQDAINTVAGPINAVAKPFFVDEHTDPMVPGTATFRVLPHDLEPGRCISADGNLRTTEAAAAGTLDDELDFDPAWLTSHPDMTDLDFGGIEANRRMQWSVRIALDGLLQRVAAELSPLHGKLTVLSGYDPSATDLRRVGRALLLVHSVISPARLAALAHAAGFDYVCHTSFGQAYVAQSRRDPFRIKTNNSFAPTTVPQPPDTYEGGAFLQLTLDPDPTVFPDVEVRWTLALCGLGDGRLIAGKPVQFQPLKAGDVSVHVEVTRHRHTRGASRTIRVGLADTAPPGLGAGHSISGLGERDVTEAAAAGTPDGPIDPAFLMTRFDDYLSLGAVDFGTDPLNRRMQRGTYRALGRLLTALSGQNGKLHVLKAYTPAGAGLLAVGRALQLFHDGMSTSRLAAFAFAAGFDFIAIDLPNTMVSVAVVAAELITVVAPQSKNNEVTIGDPPAPLYVDPEARPTSLCFATNGTRAYISDGGNDLVTSLTLSAPSALVFPQVSLDKSALVGRTPIGVAATLTQVYVANVVSSDVVVLDPSSLAVVTRFPTGQNPTAITVDANRLFVTCSPEQRLHIYDTATNLEINPSILFISPPNAVTALPGGTTVYVALVRSHKFCVIDTQGHTITATVATGFSPQSLVVAPTLPVPKLYVACSNDDSTRSSGTVRVYTTNNNTQVAQVGGFPAFSRPWQVSVSADNKYVFVVTVPQPPHGVGRVHIIDTATDTLLPEVFTPGTTQWWVATSPKTAQYLPCLLSVSSDSGMVTIGDPATLPGTAPRIAGAVNLGAGNGESLSWVAIPFSRGQIELSSASKPQVRARGVQPGRALIRATYVLGDGLRPYQFEVRLVPALEGKAGVFIRKDQYDLVMNVLNSFHPIGVEVKTGRLRNQVVELRGRPGDLFPAYTYPNFRSRGLPLITQLQEG